MEETSDQSDTELVSYIDGMPSQINGVKPAALLLTPAPVQSLKNELDQISDMGPHFWAIILGARQYLEQDSHANQLRATLMQFNEPMHSASNKIDYSICLGMHFYRHEAQEADGNWSGLITQEMVRRLLEQDFQDRAILLARKAMSEAAAAARIIREEVLPRLPQVKKDLEDYVSDYLARDNLKRERMRSWVPLRLRDVIEGGIDPTPWKAEDVKEYPRRFSIASDLLRRVPSFLDNLELHFRRLSEIDSRQMLQHGYIAFDDLIRLYEDRCICSTIFFDMKLSWHSPEGAFITGSVEYLPGQEERLKPGSTTRLNW